ncbi:FtsX-like permease family protein [Symbioplanes lichenis]|uniref:FtsX-like permease family protein n=1 Tax=Symbioplanes lichenis TaxID=1629072 RepID=UPI00273A3CA4|nr:FtsX-like permease family protein [Actinoplanes lichenis]
MTALILAMLLRRRRQAVAMALLAMLAVAAAVAAPAYLRAADRAVAAGQVDTATATERGLALTRTENDAASAGARGVSFADLGPALADLPGFTQVYAVEYPAVGIEPDTVRASRLVFRQDFCAHLTMVTGRCAAASGEIVLGASTAERLKLTAGDSVTLAYAEYSKDPAFQMYFEAGKPLTMIVAGTYTVPAPGATYWGGHGYFAANPGNRPGEPVFTPGATVAAMDHKFASKSVDSSAGPGALGVDRLDDLRAALDTLDKMIQNLGASVSVSTGLPELLTRIDDGRATARLIVPVVAVPLIVLSCFVIFLAAGYGAEARRPELAVVALRGVRRWERLLLATGENLVAVVAGALAGCLAGQLLINLMAAVLFPGVGTAAGFGSLVYAAPAALAALLAALLALRRQLFAPVAVLLRRVTGAGRRAPVLEILAVLLAVVTTVQLSLSGVPEGAGVFAAGLVIFAAALLVARILVPVAARVAARALRRGRTDVALAGLQLARRSGATSLLALLVAVSGVAAYVTCAIGSGLRDRNVIAEQGTGADRVLTVTPVSPWKLLSAVRAADPDGRFAMAVVRTEGNHNGEPAGLAVDSPRLATVATWPGSGPQAAEVARALRPAVPQEPVVIPGRDVSLRVDASNLPSGGRMLGLLVAVSSLRGGDSTLLDLGTIREGVKDYSQRTELCAGGCRLDGIQVQAAVSGNVTAHLVVTALGSVNPVAAALPADRLADPARWRVSADGSVSGGPAGLVLDIAAPNGLSQNGVLLQPADSPGTVPAAIAGRAGNQITGLDKQLHPVDRAVDLHSIPRLGLFAWMTDLEYADRAAAVEQAADKPEVWLTDDAPADVLDRLSTQGLTIAGDVRTAEVRAQLARQGPAISLWFYVLATVLALLLGAGALLLAADVDRPRQAEDLAALRVQGLSARVARRAGLWAYPMLVLVAVPAGTGAGLLGYNLTGRTLPLAGLKPPPLPLPVWPHWWQVVGVAVVVLMVLTGAAVVAGRRISR